VATTPGEVLSLGYRSTSADAAERVATAIRTLWLKHSTGARSAEDFYERWLDESAVLLTRAWSEQAKLARAYYMSLRRIEAPYAPTFIPAALPEVDQKVVRDSLYYMAFIEGRPAGEKLADYPPEEFARDERLSLISGSVVKHAMNGGRLQIKQALDSETAEFRGYYRQLGADPCGFCALLGTRHDYSKDSFDESDARFEGPGEFKVHDFCHCVLRPYWAAPALSETHQRAEQLWADIKARFSGLDNKRLISEYSKAWREQQELRAATVNQDRPAKGRAA